MKTGLPTPSGSDVRWIGLEATTDIDKNWKKKYKTPSLIQGWGLFLCRNQRIMVPADTLLNYFLKCRKVTTDSRNIPEGALFFALRGERFDGHRFVGEALDQGASFAVVDDPEKVCPDKCLQVPDVLESLQQLAVLYRATLKGTLIGITGSNGKTTTKELINAVLQKKYKTQATAGNYNNHIGVPLTLLSFPEDIDFGVVEMGANHVGEIEVLSGLSRPDYGMITNVGKAHLEGFGSFEGIVRGKSELYRQLEKTGGTAFVNENNPILMDKSSGLSRILYGGEGNAVHGKIRKAHPFLIVDCWINEERITMHTNLSGAYNLENILAAVCIGHHFGVEAREIKAAIEAYIPSNNRSQTLKTEKNTLILDAYNANPTSMEAAVRNFMESDYPQKVLILGQMLELGSDSENEHRKILNLVRDQNFSRVLLVGPNFKLNDSRSFEHFSSTLELLDRLQADPIENAAVLIKGSRGNKLEQVVKYL
jgi:UDP-N-acetylmuramoyl-tripeptide--D-alanyl-D-alanine ligase